MSDNAKMPSCLMSNVAATCLSSVAAGNDQSCQLNFSIVFTNVVVIVCSTQNQLSIEKLKVPTGI